MGLATPPLLIGQREIPSRPASPPTYNRAWMELQLPCGRNTRDERMLMKQQHEFRTLVPVAGDRTLGHDASGVFHEIRGELRTVRRCRTGTAHKAHPCAESRKAIRDPPILLETTKLRNPSANCGTKHLAALG